MHFIPEYQKGADWVAKEVFGVIEVLPLSERNEEARMNGWRTIHKLSSTKRTAQDLMPHRETEIRPALACDYILLTMRPNRSIKILFFQLAPPLPYPKPISDPSLLLNHALY